MRKAAIFAAVCVAAWARPALAQCKGDFNGDGKVTMDELITTVDNALNSCQVSGPRFVDNGDGTVTDHQTALIWEKKNNLDGIQNLLLTHDADNLYTWSSTGSAPDGTAFTDFLPRLNHCVSVDGKTVTGGFAGHCDWRLPTIAELQTIVEPMSTGCVGPSPGCVFPNLGPSGTSSFTWSSTSCHDLDSYVWDESSYDGSMGADPKYFDNYVRAVRDLASECLGDFNGDGKVTIDELVTAVDNAMNGCQFSAPRFVDNGDGTVTDHQTGLVWEKKADVPPDGPANVHDEASCYLSWSDTGTAPDGGVFRDFLAALNNCVSTDGATVTGGFAGHCDWRLPTITELQSIYDTTAPGCGTIRHPCVFPELGPSAAGYYWSSTSDANEKTEVWSVQFDLWLGGGPDHIVKGASVCARAVRNARESHPTPPAHPAPAAVRSASARIIAIVVATDR